MQIQENATYRHYKGGLYKVLFEATEEATLKTVVVYQNSKGTYWTRPIEDFLAQVTLPDGRVMPRFELC